MKLIKEDTPQYRLEKMGKHSLSDSEILSVIIGGDPAKGIEKAKDVLSKAGIRNMIKMDDNDLVSLGLTRKEAVRIVSAMELTRRMQEIAYNGSTKITTSAMASHVFEPYVMDEPHEVFVVAYLSRSNEVMKITKMFRGGITATVVDVRPIIREAIMLRASGMIVCHNHPSGNLEPSSQDNRVTKQIKEGAALLDIKLLDHIIWSDRGFYSYADNGTL